MAGKKGIGNVAMWILMGLLIIGLGGFSIGGFGGNIRSVGSVGETPISLNEYARSLQGDIRAESAARGAQLSFAQAQDLQLDQIALSRLIAAASLEEETRVMGVSIGDENLRDQIVGIPAFQGLDGSFDREAYRFQLENSGLTEAQFEEDLRAEASRTLLQGAVVSGVEIPAAYADALMQYVGERRTITWAMLDEGKLLTGLPDPDTAELTAYHQANLPRFTTPESKDITFAWLTPDMILDTVEVDEDSLRAAYLERSEEFNQPERRLVERLVFPDAAAADAGLAKIDANEASFEDLVAERGLELSDVDMGDVSRDDLDTASEAVFGASAGDVVGPIETSLGPALFRVNAILQAQNTSFEEAEPALRDELAGDRARRVIDAQIETIDDLLAGGATIEDLALETDMQLGQITWHEGMTDGIGAYDAFRAMAATITPEDYPDVAKLEDDGIFALRLNGIVEPQIQPLDTVLQEAEAGWRAETLTTLLRDQVDPALDKLAAGEDFGDHAMAQTTTLDITRGAYQPEAPAEFIDTVFEMEEGEVRVIDGDARIFVMRLDAVLPPDEEDEDMTRLRAALSNDAAQGLAQDVFQAMANDIRARSDLEINEQALNAVHANFQ